MDKDQQSKKKSKKASKTSKPKEYTIESFLGKFVTIPAGEFLMGEDDNYIDEKPVHKVIISKSFEMCTTEVTQGQWEMLMGNNPSSFKGVNQPANNISWEEAQEFIEKINILSKAYTYRLPTEAEWEYACRAGSTETHAGDLDQMAWYEANSGGKSHPVGKKKPNAWGLYDMHGNVQEWCQDWYGEYPSETVTDPQGPKNGTDKVLRGGGWHNHPKSCRSASRVIGMPSNHYFYVGFRLVRIPKELKEAKEPTKE